MLEAVIGIDLGTQSTKAVVVSKDGHPLSNVDVPMTFRRPQPSWADQDPHVLENSALEAIERVVQMMPAHVEIRGLSVAAQMGGCIGIDKYHCPVTDHEMWFDVRADADRQEILATHGNRIVSSNGIIPFVAPRVRRWLRLDPSLAGRLARVLSPGGYVIGRLTDNSAEEAICDRTQANLFGCFDAKSREWDSELASSIGLPCRFLPRLVESAEVVGTLSAKVAERCGLKAGIPVTGGLGDGTAGWLAAGGLEPGVCIDTSGSSEHFAVTVEHFTPDPEGIMTCMPSAIHNRCYLLGFTTGTGITHRWLTELVGKSYGELEERAAILPPGAGNLLFIAHIHGRVTPYQPDVRGAFVGFDDSTTDAHLYRALVESIAYEAGEWVRECRRLYPNLSIQTVSSIGGGALSPLRAQIKADVLGAPYVRLQPHVNAARGAALAAAVGVGLCSFNSRSWHDPSILVADQRDPDPRRTETYAGLVDLHRDLLVSLGPIYRRLAARTARA